MLRSTVKKVLILSLFLTAPNLKSDAYRYLAGPLCMIIGAFGIVYGVAPKKFTQTFPRLVARTSQAYDLLKTPAKIILAVAGVYSFGMAIDWKFPHSHWARSNMTNKFTASTFTTFVSGWILSSLLTSSSSKSIEPIQSTTKFKDLAGEADGAIPEEARTLVKYIQDPTIFDSVGAPQYKGLLLHGPPGTGKTLLARAIAGEAQVPFLHVDLSEVKSMWHGGSEKNVKAIFTKARNAALLSGKLSAIIFFDEFDSIAFNREATSNQLTGSVDRGILNVLLEELDGIKKDDVVKIIVLAGTNKLHDIDAAIKRPGRFDKWVELPAPNENGRKEILRKYLRTIIHEHANDAQKTQALIDWMAANTEGFVPAHLETIIQEAARNAASQGNATVSEKIIRDAVDQVHIKRNLEGHQATQAVTVKTRLKDIVGEVPQEVKRLVNYLQDPKVRQQYRADNIKPYKGILLYGPPGTGKTLLARAIAGEAQVPFYNLDCPKSKYHGETEKNITKVFVEARNSAYYNAKKTAIIFIDEIDLLCQGQQHVISGALQKEMDGFNQSDQINIVVIATTNHKDNIPAALLREGRFDQHIEITLPNLEKRKQIIAHLLTNAQYENENNSNKTTEFIAQFAATHNNASPAQLCEIIQEAQRMRIENGLPKLTNKLIEEAARKQNPKRSFAAEHIYM